MGYLIQNWRQFPSLWKIWAILLIFVDGGAQPPFSDFVTSYVCQHREWNPTGFLPFHHLLCLPKLQAHSYSTGSFTDDTFEKSKAKCNPVQQKHQKTPWFRSKLSFIARHWFNWGRTANESCMFAEFLCLCVPMFNNPILLFQIFSWLNKESAAARQQSFTAFDSYPLWMVLDRGVRFLIGVGPLTDKLPKNRRWKNVSVICLTDSLQGPSMKTLVVLLQPAVQLADRSLLALFSLFIYFCAILAYCEKIGKILHESLKRPMWEKIVEYLLGINMYVYTFTYILIMSIQEMSERGTTNIHTEILKDHTVTACEMVNRRINRHSFLCVLQTLLSPSHILISYLMLQLMPCF